MLLLRRLHGLKSMKVAAASTSGCSTAATAIATTTWDWTVLPALRQPHQSDDSQMELLL
jgi:hypothetical protein